MNEDSVIKEIGRSYIVSSFLPSALFFAVLLLLFGGFIPTSLWNKIQDDNRLLAGTWLIGSIFTVWLAFFLFSSVDWIIKFFEGYYLPTWLYRKLVSVQKRRINRKIKTYNIARNLKADPSKSNDNQRFFNSIWYDAMGDIQDLELQAPLEEQNVMPTRLGNVFKASELYAYDRYFIEAITVWPRLFAILPSQFVKDMEEKTNHLMFLLNSALLVYASAILSLSSSGLGFLLQSCNDSYFCMLLQKQSYLLNGYHTISPLKFMLIALLLIFIGYRIYDIAVNAAQDFSLFFRTGFDLYRIDLLKQLYRQLPNNLADERNMWLSISTFLIAGERLIFDERKVNYPAYKYYDNNDEKTENIGKEKREKKNPNY